MRLRLIRFVFVASLLTLVSFLPQPAFAQAKTILVIAPHPDDEALCCSGVIYANKLAGNTVKVAIVTNGDDYTSPASKSGGLTREGESIAAMTGLGLGTQDVIFLGYGDQLLQQLLFATSSSQVYTSAAGQTLTYANSGLGGVSYHQYLTGSAGSYNQATILSDFTNLLKNFAPTDIYTTGFWDDHPDHRATYAFAAQALIALKKQGLLPNTRIHETWIHEPCDSCDTSGTWPYNFAPTQPFPQPEYISSTPYDWTQIENIPVPVAMQDPNQNTNLKWNTIYKYHSQTGNDPSSYLFDFAQIQEFFWVRNFQTNVAVLATATASSQTTTGLQAASNAIDGIISGSPNPFENSLNYSSFKVSGGGEWVTAGQLAGAWIKLTWPSSVTTSQVILYGRPDGTDNVLSGTLTFSDGSSVAVGALPVGGAGLPVNFASKTITWMQFTINAAQGKNIGLSEIEVFGNLTSSSNTFGPQMTDGPVADNANIGIADTANLTASTFDIYGYPLTYTWSTNGGSISGSGTSVTYTPPATPGTYTNTVSVADGHGGSTQNSTFMVVGCTICGTVSGGAAGSTTITLSGKGTGTATTNAAGAYDFTSALAAGSYTVTPSSAGYTFSPASQSVTVGNSSVTGVNFTTLYTISGTVSGGAGTTITLSGASSATTTADASGAYSFTGLAAGTYKVTPALAGYVMTPTSQNVTISNANVTLNFLAQVAHSISGTISGAGGSGATVTVTGTLSGTATANASGVFTVSNLVTGNYTVTPSSAGYTFSPANQAVTIGSTDVSGVAFNTLYSASGTIAGAAGVTLTLSSNGSTVATATSGASGVTYSLTGLTNGTYTLTPSLLGYTFAPTSAVVVVNGANVSVPTFTATALTYAISGTITGVGGATVTLTSGSNTVATIMAGASGTTYSFTNIPFGTYSVKPSLTGYTFTPASTSVTINGSNVTGINFSGAQSLFTSQTPVLTGKSDGSSSNYELGMLFQSDIAGQITGIRFWKDAKESGTHTGRIWSSTGTQLASVVFTNETASGWQVQSLTTPLSINANTTYVVSVNTGATYYVDTVSGLLTKVTNLDLSSVVTTNNGVYATAVGTFPASSYSNSNYFRDVTFVPAAAATYTVAGTINGAGGATVTLTSGASTVATTTANGSGVYSFTGVLNGGYTVTPSLSGYTFSPTSASVTVNGANATVTTFTATALTYSISGTISGPGANGATVKLAGTSSATTTANSSGAYSFSGVQNGSYTVTPSLSGYTFSPTSANVTVSSANVSVTPFASSAVPTYTLSGTITGVAGATVTLTSGGSTVATLTTGASGSTFSFPNVANGSYTVTPTLSGYTFSPSSASVIVNGANTSASGFTATSSTQFYAISGVITGAAGATVTLSSSGSTVATLVSGASGSSYSFTNLPNGSYTVTPTLTGYTFLPVSIPVIISGASVTGVNFSNPQSVFTTQTPVLTGKTDGVNLELGMLFQSDIAGQITGVRFWKDANETGTHTGNIWSSTGTLLASVAFTGETPSGWQVQNLTTPLTIAANTVYVVSVNTGNTYYVQTVSGLLSQITNLDLSSVVTTNNGVYGSAGAFPTGSYANSNYFRDVTFVPSAAPTYTISGTIAGVGGATVTLISNGSTVTTGTADGSGNYSFTNIPNGSYSVTPSLAGYTFSPTSAAVTVSGANASVSAFTATAQTYTISGSVTGVAGATVTLTSGGSTVATLSTGASGTTYNFTNIPNGSYTVTPSLPGYTFSPTSAAVTVSGANASASAFTASAVPQTYSISGTINRVAGATLTLTSGGSTVATITSGAAGTTYSFTSVPNGTYTVTPTLSGYSFVPASASVTVSGGNVTGINFSISESVFTTQTPVLTGKSDGSSSNHELGMLFQSAIAGNITGVRFWKDANETGTHTGHIWSSTGTLLATVTFTSETASGWQVQSLATPLAIAANTPYVVSVNTGNTYYVDTYSGLLSSITNLDLSSVVTTNNGVYGTIGTFPTSSYSNSNYFRDVVFVP